MADGLVGVRGFFPELKEASLDQKNVLFSV
jgi:hypothetical protein